MDRYIHSNPEDVVNTAIRSLGNLTKHDIFTESCMVLGESSNNKNNTPSDPSLKEKIIQSIDKATEAINNLGKEKKAQTEPSIKKIKSWKNISDDMKAKVRDYKKRKELENKTQKELEKAYDAGEDASVVDKIMKTYNEHKGACIVATAVTIIAAPALIRGIIEGYQDAVVNSTSAGERFQRKVAKDIANGKVDPKAGAVFARANTTIVRDQMNTAHEEFNDAFAAIDKIHKERDNK